MVFVAQVKDVRVPENLQRAMAAEAEAARNARAKVIKLMMLMMIMIMMMTLMAMMMAAEAEAARNARAKAVNGQLWPCDDADDDGDEDQIDSKVIAAEGEHKL